MNHQIFSAQEEEMLKRAIDHYYRLLDASLPSEEELQGITFSPTFEKKMEKMLRHPQKPFLQRPFFQYAAAIFLICILSCGILFSSLKIHQMLKEQGNSDSSSSLAIQDDDPSPFYKVPKGLKYQKSFSHLGYTTAYYEGRGGKWLNITAYSSGFPTDYYPVDESFLILNQYPATYAANKTDGVIVVHLEYSVYVIEGSYGKTKLLKVAESICTALQ